MTSVPIKARAGLYARIRAAWDLDAAAYDRRPGHGILTTREHAAWRRVLTDALSPISGDAPLRIVDVGAGTGAMAILLAGMGHSVTAVDLSPAMLARARDKAAQRGLDVEIVEANARHLPLAENSVDLVLSRHLFWTLVEPVATLREWVRVVRHGGMVAVADGWWNEPSASMRWRRSTAALLRNVLSHRNPGHSGYADLRRHLPVAGGVSAYSIRYYLDQAGLERLRVRDLRSIRAAERRSMPPWDWIDQARFTWLATGFKPNL